MSELSPEKRALIEEIRMNNLLHESLMSGLTSYGSQIVNLVINREGDDPEFLSSLFDGEPYEIIDHPMDLYDVLVHVGRFQSRTQARKNGVDNEELPPGFSYRYLGKGMKAKLVSTFLPV